MVQKFDLIIFQLFLINKQNWRPNYIFIPYKLNYVLHYKNIMKKS